LIGFFLNILSLIVLNNKDISDMTMYKYLRVYAFTGIIVNFIFIFDFLAVSFRYIPFAKAYQPQVYYSYILLPVVSNGYLYSTILDIIITLDRISFFNRRVKSLLVLSAYRTCLVGLIATFLINFSCFCVFQPTPLINAKTGEQVGWYSALTPFGLSQPGIIVSYIVSLYRDFALLFIEIAVNFVSVYYLRRHLKNKSKLIHGTTQATAYPVKVVDQMETTFTVTVYQTRQNTERNTAIPTLGKRNTALPNLGSTKKSSESRVNRKLTLMAMCLSLLSIFDHFMYVLAVIWPYISTDLYGYGQVTLMSDVAVTVKQASNFLVFFAFNKIFRNCVFKMFRFRPS
jgi:hypothetical protein